MTEPISEAVTPRKIGDYVLHEPIGAGGMAEVHFGQRTGPGGFSRVVAVKRIRADRADVFGGAALEASLVDEVRILCRIEHPNVVRAIDAVVTSGELFVVLDYVHGESLGRLVKLVAGGREIPPPIAVAIVSDLLRGLHAAHEAKAADGTPLELVHRDVSPHNVLVDVDGVARLLDFGIAKAKQRVQETATGQIKGRLRYLSPEQVHGPATRRSDVFAAGVVLWELLAGRSLFGAESDSETLANVLGARIPRPSEHGAAVPPSLDAVVLRALDRRPDARFPTAEAMLEALVAAGVPPASRAEVGDWVRSLAARSLDARDARVRALEASLARPERVEQGERSEAAPLPAPALRVLPRGIVIATAGVVAFSLGLFLAMRPGAPPASIAPLAPSAGDTLGPSGAAPEATVPSVPTLADPAPVEPGPAAATARRPPPRGAGGARHPPPSAGSSPKAGCTPPYEIDATGVKVYKRECFPAR